MVAPNVGLEPTTPRLRVSCSTDWASRAACMYQVELLNTFVFPYLIRFQKPLSSDLFFFRHSSQHCPEVTDDDHNFFDTYSSKYRHALVILFETNRRQRGGVNSTVISWAWIAPIYKVKLFGPKTTVPGEARTHNLGISHMYYSISTAR